MVKNLNKICKNQLPLRVTWSEAKKKLYQPVAWEGNKVKNVNEKCQRSKQNMYQPVAREGNMVIDLNQIIF